MLKKVFKQSIMIAYYCLIDIETPTLSVEIFAIFELFLRKFELLEIWNRVDRESLCSQKLVHLSFTSNLILSYTFF